MGIELTTSRLRQLRQLPAVQHVRFTPLKSRQKTQLQWRARGCTGQLTTCLECTWCQFQHLCVLILNCALALAICAQSLQESSSAGTRGRLNIKMSYKCIDPDYKDKTVSWGSYFISNTWKDALYIDMIPCIYFSFYRLVPSGSSNLWRFICKLLWNTSPGYGVDYMMKLKHKYNNSVGIRIYSPLTDYFRYQKSQTLCVKTIVKYLSRQELCVDFNVN